MTYYEQQVKKISAKFEKKRYLYIQLTQARDFIFANIGETITVDHIASAACFSKFHFLRLFKSVYQCTPHEYLTGLRIRKAKQLLQEGIGTSEVCEAVGFSSTGTFKLLFKKHTSHTPHGYRQYIEQISCQKHPLTISPYLEFYKKSNFKDGDQLC